MKNKIISGLSILALVIGGYLFVLSQQEVKDAKAGTLIRSANVIGTGTSTSGTYNFNSTAATTSAVIVLGGETDIVDLMIYPESASSTAHLTLQVLTTSLSRCASAVTNDREWTDALLTNTPTAAVTTIANSTSTISWVPTATAFAKRVQLTNVNANCMKVYVGGKSVNTYIQANLKTLSF